MEIHTISENTLFPSTHFDISSKRTVQMTLTTLSMLTALHVRYHRPDPRCATFETPSTYGAVCFGKNFQALPLIATSNRVILLRHLSFHFTFPIFPQLARSEFNNAVSLRDLDALRVQTLHTYRCCFKVWYPAEYSFLL